ncbi:ATP-binding cassette domain-containing protein [Acuticoccus sp. I52.16.1]|uniref:branched-chain amino acid ABC transporter ATP-binding protein/permease n=1 Tax=Acuticoccus sp. I52.16.1 TaxID=2928472 RepID=UPI001FD25F62|nr:branched-chain amino acid ABC transporter ATP-binding protein/permease [Acuticoccus sp. I52.16.1]UOM36445.1 branched-chain amino acid ABC transporter ATP-binding protein/permease [Acuticoccus sp. I52.16.1]
MPTTALAELPRLRLAREIGQTALAVVFIAVVALGLWYVLGRTGERIAIQMCVFVTAVVALGVFTGNSGIVSFGHSAFMALGAYTAGILAMPALMQRTALPQLPAFLAGWELSPWVALVPAALVGLLAAGASGLAIARLRGASATIATLGLLIIVHSVLIGAREITRGSQTFFGVPRVTTFWVALAAAIAFIVAARLYRESRWGLMLRAVRDDEAAATALGIDARRMTFIAWAGSGAMAAVAGALYGFMLGAFSPTSFYFGLIFALVAMLIIGGMATVSGAVTGVVLVTLLQDGVRQLEGGVTVAGVELPAVFGLTTVALSVAILLVIWLRPEGLIGTREASVSGLGRLIAAFLPRRDIARGAPIHAAKGLTVSRLTKRFAGLTAVDQADFAVPPGSVTGLIGPNGAGKSTVVNLLTAQFLADEGSMRFGETELTGLPAHRIAPLGLARTFQNIRLFGTLTVYENVLVAAIAAGHAPPAASSLALREIAALELGDVADTLAASLPYGARKRLEIARCLAQEPSLILLDEPAAGMNPDETTDLADRLTALTAERGIGLLLIDHDLEFVNRLSSSIVVMNRGKVIASGTPDTIRQDPAVIEAYIGRGRAHTKDTQEGAQP